MRNHRSTFRILHWTDLDAQYTAILGTIGWMLRELADMARVFGRFTSVRQADLTPWLENIRRRWPAAVGGAR